MNIKKISEKLDGMGYDDVLYYLVKIEFANRNHSSCSCEACLLEIALNECRKGHEENMRMSEDRYFQEGI